MEEESPVVLVDDAVSVKLEDMTSLKVDAADTRALINRFQEDRDKKRIENFVRVAALGALMCLFGVFGCIVTFCLQSFSSGLEVNNDGATAAFLILFFFYTNGMIVISLCLNDHFDADFVLESPSSKYTPLRYLFSVGLFLISLPAAGFPPYFGVAISLSAASMSLSSFKRYSWDRFTFKLSVYMILWVVIFDWAFLYGGIMHLSRSSFEALSIISPLVPLPPHAKGRAMAPAFLLISALLTLLLALSLRALARSNIKPTKQTLYCLYVFLSGIATCLVVLGAAIVYLSANPPTNEGDPDLDYTDGFYPGFAIFVVGCEFVIPIVLVLAVGPKRVFNYMSARFDSNRDNLVEDGAFVAELLDHQTLKVGKTWYVHWDVAGLPVRSEHPVGDCRRNWYQGRIVVLPDDGKCFTVLLRNGDDEPREISLEIKGGGGGGVKTLLEEARENLRCIDWSDITLDLFVSSVRDANAKPCFDYSRPVKPGEVIDYFISHSWSDEGEAKFHRLSELASYHRRKYHCFPTFWLDKVCINQSNIGAGLKCLPINIMACRFMLVLNGDTYTNRLWCVWELVRRQLFFFFNPPALLSLTL